MSPLSLTTHATVSVVFDVDALQTPREAGAPAEETCPVEVVLVAKLSVPRDVNAAVVDPPQRAQPQ